MRISMRSRRPPQPERPEPVPNPQILPEPRTTASQPTPPKTQSPAATSAPTASLSEAVSLSEVASRPLARTVHGSGSCCAKSDTELMSPTVPEHSIVLKSRHGNLKGTARQQLQRRHAGSKRHFKTDYPKPTARSMTASEYRMSSRRLLSMNVQSQCPAC